MNIKYVKNLKLPDNPGVYFFFKGKDILYIGKATSLRDRVKSYFPSTTLGIGRLLDSRGPMILDMVTLADNLKWQETDSVLEALILEANLIKKYQPKYNTKEKDNKSFNYVCITKENIPKIKIERGRNIVVKNYKNIFGPFPNGNQLKEAMKIIRRIFPYIDNDSIKKHNKEFYKQLGLTPSEDYKNNLKNIKLLFQGKKKSIINGLKKEMMILAKKKEFERAGEIKKKIFALEHINDVALIKDDITQKNTFEKVLGRGGREPVPDHFQKYFPAPYIVAVVKDDKHKARAIMGDEAVIKKHKKDILLANSEAHRFAITFHKARRSKDFLKQK